MRLINDPISSAIVHIYKEKLKKRGYSDDYCSTVKYAIEILHLGMKPTEIEAILNNLEHEL